MAILVSNDYRIVKIDNRNLTFEEYKANKKGEKSWTQVGEYYPNLDQTCKALKEYIVNTNVETCKNVYELIELLTDIQIRYHTIEFEVKECK